MKISRRSFLKAAAAIGASLAWAGPARGSRVHWHERRDLYPQGVASGDPDPHSVILWTRRPFAQGTRQLLTVEVAEDEAFRRVVAHAQAPVSSAADWTARVLIGGLEPARTYWYRFTDADGNGSRVGRTITAPLPDDPRTVNFAFVSCQDVNEGKLNAYRRMIYEDERAPAAEQLGFVLHLGDFIYEVVEYPDEVKTRYDRTIYEVARIPDGHKVGNFHIPLTVDGYRAIYKGYLADPDLQDARARWPFVCIWDNHEFSWQGWQSIVKAGTFEQPGQSVKVAANQAWFEYLPARVAPPSGSLERFDPPAVKDVPIDGVRRRRAGDGAEQPDGDQQPQGLPGAALRPAPGRDHHRPAQLPERGSASAIRRWKARRRRVHRHVPRVPDADSRRRARLQRRQSSCGGPLQRRARPQPATERAAADDPRGGAEGVVQGQAPELDGDVEDLGQLPGRARPARRPAEPARGSHQGALAGGRRYAALGGGDYGTASCERAEIYQLVRDAKITGFAIVSGDRHSFWAGYAAAELPPGKFEPVGLSFVGASLTSPGAMEAYEHSLPKDAPLRPLFLADRAGGAKPDWTFNMLLRHGVRSCLEYAKSFDLERATVAVQPGSRAAPRVRRSGRTRLREGPAVGRRDAHRVRLHPAPHYAQRTTGRRAHPVSGRAHRGTVEERRAPAAEDIGARRRRRTVDLTDSRRSFPLRPEGCGSGDTCR